MWCWYVSVLLWHPSRLCCHLYMMLVCESMTTFKPVLPRIYDAGMWVCSCDTHHACVATFIWCEYVSLWQSSRLCCHVHMILVCECASVTPSIPVLQLIYDVSMWVCVSDALRVLSRIHHVDVLCAFSCDALDTCVATCIWCVTTYIWCMQVCTCCPSCVASHTPCSCIVCVFMWRPRYLCCHVYMMCYHVYMMYASMSLCCPSCVATHTPCLRVIWDEHRRVVASLLVFASLFLSPSLSFLFLFSFSLSLSLSLSLALHAYVPTRLCCHVCMVGKTKRESSKRNYYNISPRVIQKATIIMISVYEYTFVFTPCYCVMILFSLTNSTPVLPSTYGS